MIKSLLGDDENLEKERSGSRPEEESSKTAFGKTLNIEAASDPGESEFETKSKTESSSTESSEPPRPQAVKPFEVVEPIGKPRLNEISVDPAKQDSERVDDALLGAVSASQGLGVENPKANGVESDTNSKVLGVEAATALDDKGSAPEHINIVPKSFEPDSTSETVRKTGLAGSAAIVLFGSVVFMMMLGWFVDLIFGSAPWGIVGGIVVGSIVGFVQFFRTTAQILRPPGDQIKKYPLYSNQDDVTKK